LIKLRLLIVIALVVAGFQKEESVTNKPLHFNMASEYLDIADSRELFHFSGNDSLVTHCIELLSNKNKEPLFFYADIETPVCADGECKLAKIKIYWNLLGNYIGYGIDNQTPLTKNEHDPFTSADYKKLHQLLSDRHSILERREMDDLIDEVPVVGEALKTYKGIDAISGATKKEIKESVVKGGLYSCYTLWHLANGEVVKDMQKQLKSMYSDTINDYFLKSLYVDYQEYGLKNLKQQDFGDHFDDIIQIFKETTPITRAYILKKIPNELFVEMRVTNRFYGLFSSVDMNTRTQLIQKMKVAHFDSSQILVEQIPIMTKNQLTAYLKYLEAGSVSIKKKVKSNLRKTSNYKEYTYNYLIKEFLKK
jgi:hypothetical protein